MQHKSADGLRQNTRCERRNRASTTPKRTDNTHAANLILATDASTEYHSCAGVDGAQEETDDGEGNGVTDYVGNAPDYELEGGGA